jgi:ATP/maltotriose-dependent transcriptional regulator MalT
VDLGRQCLPEEPRGLPWFNSPLLPGPPLPRPLSPRPLLPRPLLPRPRLTELINRATRHKVALVCGPAGAGKTVACAQWAAAPSGDRQVVWLTLSADEDKSWFWADLYGRLRWAHLMPREAAAYLEEASADSFPFRLVEMARQLTTPVVLVVDNAHTLDDPAVVAGLDVLIRHAPPTLCLLLAGRYAPGISLDRLRAAGELATVGPADLARTSDETDAYLAMAASGFPRAGQEAFPARGPGLIGELLPRRSGPKRGISPAPPMTGEAWKPADVRG